MMKRRHLMALGLVALAGLSSCAPPWTVVAQAVPNPLAGQRNFAVMPIDYNGLRVGEKTEAAWMSGKDEDARQSWIGDKTAMNDEFAKALMEDASGNGIRVGPPTENAPFKVEPHIEWVEPGTYTYFVNRAPEIRMVMQITDPDGGVIDEIIIQHATPATMTNPSSGGRFRDSAEAIGEIAAQYLGTRVNNE